jgi:hypothetical protein
MIREGKWGKLTGNPIQAIISLSLNASEDDLPCVGNQKRKKKIEKKMILGIDKRKRFGRIKICL